MTKRCVLRDEMPCHQRGPASDEFAAVLDKIGGKRTAHVS